MILDGVPLAAVLLLSALAGGLWRWAELQAIGTFRVRWYTSICILLAGSALFVLGATGWLGFAGSFAMMTLGALCVRIAFWTRWGATHG